MKATDTKVKYDFTLLTDDDLFLFNEGTHLRLYEKLGSHLVTHKGVAGTYFAVWAPSAAHVGVIGDFNGWDRGSHPLRARGSSGIWEGFVPGVGSGTKYKYWVESQHAGYKAEKGDPFAVHAETPPLTASIVWDREQEWTDAPWLAKRADEVQPAGAGIDLRDAHRLLATAARGQRSLAVLPGAGGTTGRLS